MDFFEKTGKMAIGSRLRQLTAKITEDAAKIYGLYQVALSPKWFPVFFVLAREGEKTVTEIAHTIGHSQPSVSKIIREMTGAGLLEQHRKSDDKRRNVVALTAKGHLLNEHIKMQYTDVENAVEKLTEASAHDLWGAIAEWETLLAQKSLYDRVREQKRLREKKEVTIVPFQAQHATAFKTLNEAWIKTYFQMEDSDHRALDHPQEYILDRGGAILMALYQNEVVGTCALVKMDDPEFDYELAKMAVSSQVQGNGIGRCLAEAVIQKARDLGAKKIYLESNTVLKPAIAMYRTLGFQKIHGRPTPYKRCDIQMELVLSD
ncbi:MAG: bifunctional helix-turn-helix transcriptional regulator/GNAT family N-acetyltransferase [Sediminicola sp.]